MSKNPAQPSPSGGAARDLILPLLFVLLLALAFGLHYVARKPFTPAALIALARAVTDLGVAALLTCVGGGLGRRALRALAPPRPGEGLVVQLAFGWGLLSLGMLALGLAGLYHAVLVWVLVLLALVLLRRDVRAWLAELAWAIRAPGAGGWAGLAATWFVGLVLALGLMRALAPPVAWDALDYHLTLPRLYVQSGGVRLPGDVFFSAMPQFTEMLNTAAFLLRGTSDGIAAQVLGYLMALLAILGVRGLAGDVLGPAGRTWAPAILLSSLSLGLALSWAYTDWPLTLLALAALMALRVWRRENDRRWLWLAGALAGFAAGCKYTGLSVALAGTLVILLRADPRAWRARLGDALAFGALVALTFAPWLLKNWAFTGSPVTPLIFPSAYVDAQRAWFLARPDLAEHDPLNVAALFFRVSLWVIPHENPNENLLGPVFLVFGLALLLGWRRLDGALRAELKPFAGWVAGGYVAWMVFLATSQYGAQARLFYPFLPALAILAASGRRALAALDRPALRVSLVADGALLFALALALWSNAANFAAANPLAYLTGTQSAAAYREARLGAYAPAMDGLAALPAGARVVFLWEPRALECPPTVVCEPDSILDRWWRERRTGDAPEVILARWRAAGVTHVLVAETGLAFVRAEADSRGLYAPEDWDALDALRGEMQRAGGAGTHYTLYALR